MSVDHAQVTILMEAFQALAAPYAGQASATIDIQQRLGAGTGANQFDHVHKSTRDPGATTAEDVDLRLLTDAEGTVMSTLTEVVYLAVSAPIANTANYEIKPSAANGWLGFLKDASDIIVIPPGETKVLVCNFADGKNIVGASTKSINVNNLGDANSTLDFIMLARSA